MIAYYVMLYYNLLLCLNLVLSAFAIAEADAGPRGLGFRGESRANEDPPH